jgi:hypothetical protein
MWHSVSMLSVCDAEASATSMIELHERSLRERLQGPGLRSQGNVSTYTGFVKSVLSEKLLHRIDYEACVISLEEGRLSERFAQDSFCR